jgi:hypothetical protein
VEADNLYKNEEISQKPNPTQPSVDFSISTLITLDLHLLLLLLLLLTFPIPPGSYFVPSIISLFHFHSNARFQFPTSSLTSIIHFHAERSILEFEDGF